MTQKQAKPQAKRCRGCGHNFDRDQPIRNGLCSYCVEEADNPETCHVCGKVATCRGEGGYLCGSQDCRRTDELADQRIRDTARDELDGEEW